MKYLPKNLLILTPLIFLSSCGVINSDQDSQYDWYGTWKQIDSSFENYYVLAENKLSVYVITSDQDNSCISDSSPINKKSETDFTYSGNDGPVYVSITFFSSTKNRMTLRFDVEDETNTFVRSELPESCDSVLQ